MTARRLHTGRNMDSRGGLGSLSGIILMDGRTGLKLIHAVIAAAKRHQLIVAASFYDFPAVQDEDFVSAADCRQPVGDDECRPPLLKDFQRLLDEALRLGVDIGCGLIESGSRGRRRARGRMRSVGAALRTACCLFHDRLVEALRQMGKQPVRADFSERPFHFFPRYALVFQADVRSDRSGE